MAQCAMQSFLARNSIANACLRLIHPLSDLFTTVVHVSKSLLVLSVLRLVAELSKDKRTNADNTKTCENSSSLHLEG